MSCDPRDRRSDFRKLGIKRCVRLESKKSWKGASRSAAVTRQSRISYRGGQIDPPPPPVKIGLTCLSTKVLKIQLVSGYFVIEQFCPDDYTTVKLCWNTPSTDRLRLRTSPVQYLALRWALLVKYALPPFINPKRAGGGGGGGAESAPPSTFRAIISWKIFSAPRAFMTFCFQVLRNFWRYFQKNRPYGSKVTQHYVIERRLKIWQFSGFVYKTYGKWLLVPKLHFEL